MSVKADDIRVVLTSVKTALSSTAQHSESQELVQVADGFEQAADILRPYAVSDEGVAIIAARGIMPKISHHIVQVEKYAAARDLPRVIFHSRRVLMALPGDPASEPKHLPLLLSDAEFALRFGLSLDGNAASDPKKLPM